MWDWERASVPYRPIYRRRLLRRRVLTLLIIAAIALPYYLYHHARAAQSVGQRVFDQVASTIALRYFDPSYHGASWSAVAERYRPLVVNAPTVRARYAALRAMLSQLRDSHTAVYSPQDLQPPRDQHRHAVFGMSPDGFTDGPAVDWKALAPGVGYLRITSFPDSMRSVLQWAMSDLGRDRALVLDLRGNPGGLVDSVDEVAGMFLPAGTLISTGTRRYHFFGSQRFTATGDAGITYAGRVVVLIDKNSRSGAESLARALQYYHRATLVGTHTAGKVLGVDAEIALDDGGLLRVATLDMHAPDGQRLEGRGVSPEVVVQGAAEQYRTALALADDQSDMSPKPSASGCPVDVNAFSEDAVGKPNGYEQYYLKVNRPLKTVFVTFAVRGATETRPAIVTVPNLSQDNTAFVFAWPSRDLTAIGVREVFDPDTGVEMDCSPVSFHPLDSPNPEKYPDKATYNMLRDQRYAVGNDSFDDSNTQFSAVVTALTLRDSDFILRSQVQYPETAKEQGIQGCAVVKLTIGTGGKLVAANLVKPACGFLGCASLNDAALKAAHASTFVEPQVDGKPVERDYLVDYCWFLGV